MEPRLSILMACYMQEKYVAEAIDSVLASKCDFSTTELILWDDGSTDGTGAILEEYRKRHPEFIRLHRSPKNLGIADCTAKMVEAARGRYFMLFDSDDVLLPFNVNDELEFLDSHPDYVASYGRKFMFDQDGFHGEGHGGPCSDFMMLLHPPINNNAMIVRRRTALEVGNYRPVSPGGKGGALDVFMWLRLRMAGKFRYDPQVRVLYRVHPHQSTRSVERDAVYARDYRFILNYLGEKYPDLLKKLEQRGNFKLARREVSVALMLLGGLIRNEPDLNKVEQYLFLADQISPRDCDVKIQIAELAFRRERYEEAVERFFEAFIAHEDDYFRIIICNELFRCYEKLGRKTDGLLLGFGNLSNRVLYLPPESAAVLNNLKKYD